jgi:hypothetical protein
MAVQPELSLCLQTQLLVARNFLLGRADREGEHKQRLSCDLLANGVAGVEERGYRGGDSRRPGRAPHDFVFPGSGRGSAERFFLLHETGADGVKDLCV